MPDVIDKVISLFSGDSEPGSDKDILLKQLAKEISQNKYAKFYRIKQGEADPALAQYFYSIYKLIYPLQVFLQDIEKEAKIRQITLEAFLDKNAMDVLRRLSPDAITERRKTAGEELPKQLRDDLGTLSASFDSPKIATADECYNLIASMKQFVCFNFCAFLKKFDPEIREGDFLNPPKFIEVEASLLAPELATFLSVLPPFEESKDWKTVFEILKYCRGGTDVIPLAQWKNLLLNLRDLIQSRIMSLIGRLATGNPIWEIKPNVPHETLSASFLEQKNQEVHRILQAIAGSQRSAQISALLNSVFGSTDTTRLAFYTADKGRTLSDRGLDDYVYAPALNHLLAFINDFLSKEMQELCDIMLIRGQWTNNTASRMMSEGFHEVLQITGEITELDETLDEDGSNGPRLRGALLRVDRDKTQVRYINSIIGSINEESLNMINRAVSSLIVVGKHLKMLLDDYDKKPFELIMNWKELTLVTKTPLIQRIAAAYKKVNYFVQLMLLETKPADE